MRRLFGWWAVTVVGLLAAWGALALVSQEGTPAPSDEVRVTVTLHTAAPPTPLERVWPVPRPNE